ncbi:ABC transporter permease [Mesorhizobium sp. M4A.F.Ca.ET.022.05.2.1]|uniref:ABC transporter permease n=1 Tax=Mesorhizobium sp. M4A.F.Ca.ET.022.05.2.1 TaxID=2496653 RepID=UPI000FCAB730|nr:ABC transporter permease [Mesorhizobium sp. M4A.F.Ca.ET.022.05.2.1]RVC72315.1 ABC transporter permease [Mesorhizobium sp. M2A.F.Ca.ET.046.02.1.1]TIU42923.1 MAG: ABC transporter permease subunit [Mesorhizobium sp.]RVC82527.1 ABC transporter permease [Mesorhizobium sp. M4A.F.Ca.ET.022.05.2.1]TIW60141.1 MAG: ABC transporter permease subunit [Mesorhizobium sp.]TJW31080.1 MAG: ABC transporter permease subunit [Mesorhizobium sp.]
MLKYAIRRLLFAVPTLLLISLLIFSLLKLAPGDPLSQLPLTIPPEVREKMRAALGVNKSLIVQYLLWLKQFFVIEPLHGFDVMFGTHFSDGMQRIISWQTRGPVFSILAERLPQTLLVVGLAYIIGVLIALPIGIISAYKQYSVFDQIGTSLSILGLAVPSFFSGVLAILIFSVYLDWLPTIYNTNLVVDSWSSFLEQLLQMAMPVMVLAVQTTASISRYLRSSMLDNLNQDYVRTVRAKGMSEKVVVFVHVLRNSMIPVVTVITLGLPGIFGGAIVTEQIFKVNGIGQLLITAIYANDVPLVQTLAFIFAVLIVVFNLIADLLYGVLDPRIRYG